MILYENFAKQSKVPIVVVKMSPSPWAASEWLGIITGESILYAFATGANTLLFVWHCLYTAGSLWTPLHDETTRQENMRSLMEQVRAAASTTAGADSPKTPRTVVVSSGASEELKALRSELDSLRADLAKAATRRIAADDQAADSVTLAPIPAEVPPLSLNCRPTADMEKLKVMLIDSDNNTMAVTATKSKVGALGMVSNQALSASILWHQAF